MWRSQSIDCIKQYGYLKILQVHAFLIPLLSTRKAEELTKEDMKAKN